MNRLIRFVKSERRSLIGSLACIIGWFLYMQMPHQSGLDQLLRYLALIFCMLMTALALIMWCLVPPATDEENTPTQPPTED